MKTRIKNRQQKQLQMMYIYVIDGKEFKINLL